jgi:spore maturation protein CgeB
VAPLYGSVDPDVHRPAATSEIFSGDLSYLGTYAPDRQDTLNQLLVEAARRLPGMRFVIGGAQYPNDFPWTSNIFFVRHLPPALHPAFYCSSRATLNVTRRAMAAMGYCPSGRIFEAAACNVPLLTDYWDGLEQFYTPGSEVIVCRDTEHVIQALSLSDVDLQKMAARARERTLDEHTALHRVKELEAVLEKSCCAVEV